MYYINWGVIKILKETINIFEHNEENYTDDAEYLYYTEAFVKLCNRVGFVSIISVSSLGT